jgi:hypothetical protein
MSSAQKSNEAFLKAIDRARLALRDSSQFIASLESHWRRAMQSSPAEVLDCSDEVWCRIALCYRPRDNYFTEDIQVIAVEAQVDRPRLQDFLVTALAVERLANAPSEDGQAPVDLLAARERDDSET